MENAQSNLDSRSKRTVAVIDFSWLCYKNRYALSSLGVPAIDQLTGKEFIRPTGHVFGGIRDIVQLSRQYNLVILAVDAYTKWRKQLLPGYKSGRHEAKGDLNLDFPIRQDFVNIIGLLTFLKNVVFIEKFDPSTGDGYEADDVISSCIAATLATPDGKDYLHLDQYDVSVYAVDNDLLQIPGKYLWFRNISEPPTDRAAYIKSKFGFDLDYLPHIYKVTTGDASDKIPIGLLRFPRKLLTAICSQLSPTQSYSIEDYAMLLQSYGKDCGGQIKTQLQALSDKSSEVYQRLEINYKVTQPWLFPVKVSDLQRKGWTLSQIEEVLVGYDCLAFLSDFTSQVGPDGR